MPLGHREPPRREFHRRLPAEKNRRNIGDEHAYGRLLDLVQDERPRRDRQERNTEDLAQHLGGDRRLLPVSKRARQRVIEQRGDKNACNDRYRPPKTRGQEERQSCVLSPIAGRDDQS